MNPRQRGFLFISKKKNSQQDCLNEYFNMNEITKKKKIKLSDCMHGDQVLHRFQKSKLMLYNSVPKTKTTTETFLQDYLKRIRESNYIEIPLQI